MSYLGSSNIGNLMAQAPTGGLARVNALAQQAANQNMQQQWAASARAAQAAQQQSLYNQQIGHLGTYTKRYMIDGKAMNFDEFIDALFPEDCAERTYLILKLKGKEDVTKST